MFISTYIKFLSVDKERACEYHRNGYKNKSKTDEWLKIEEKISKLLPSSHFKTLLNVEK